MLFLHKNNISHRDLKPSNIMIKNDVMKICDFGFASKVKNIETHVFN